jgi:hypothetical protein
VLPYGQRLLDQLLVERHRRSLPSRGTRRNPDSMGWPDKVSKVGGEHRIALHGRPQVIAVPGL